VTSDEQFWWNWWVQFATALGTIGAVMLALFGNWFRYRFAPPKLSISLLDPAGEETEAQIRGVETEAQIRGEVPPTDVVTKVRWFHVRVQNDRIWAEATDVQVFLLSVEEPDASDQFTSVWTGAVPLKWRHMQSMNPAATRTFGYPYDADLVAFFKRATTTPDPFMQLQVLLPLGRLSIFRVGKARLRLTLQARGRYTASNRLTVVLAWDGTWPESAEQARRRIVVSEVAPS
jgi:hypothetical protein